MRVPLRWEWLGSATGHGKVPCGFFVIKVNISFNLGLVERGGGIRA